MKKELLLAAIVLSTPVFASEEGEPEQPGAPTGLKSAYSVAPLPREKAEQKASTPLLSPEQLQFEQDKLQFEREKLAFAQQKFALEQQRARFEQEEKERRAREATPQQQPAPPPPGTIIGHVPGLGNIVATSSGGQSFKPKGALKKLLG